MDYLNALFFYKGAMSRVALKVVFWVKFNARDISSRNFFEVVEVPATVELEIIISSSV